MPFSNLFLSYQQVNPYLGAVIEGVATLLCRLASRALGELGPRHAPIIDSFIGTSLVVAGIFLILDFSKRMSELFHDQHIPLIISCFQHLITLEVISTQFWQPH